MKRIEQIDLVPALDEERRRIQRARGMNRGMFFGAENDNREITKVVTFPNPAEHFEIRATGILRIENDYRGKRKAHPVLVNAHTTQIKYRFLAVSRHRYIRIAVLF